jgi:hypothetical protein
MCSNFGFNHHPGRAPCALETSWYAGLVRFVAYLRSKIRRRALKLRSTPTRPFIRHSGSS